MRLQRDNYGFLHNQALRLANNGMKIQDVGEAIEQLVPESLSQVWHTTVITAPTVTMLALW